MISVYKIKMLKTGAQYLQSDLVLKIIDDLVASDRDKNQMVDEKESMGFLMQWGKWGMGQVLAAWDQLFSMSMNVDSTVELLDQVMFGTLQGIMEGDYNVNSLVEQIQNANVEDIMSGMSGDL